VRVNAPLLFYHDIPIQRSRLGTVLFPFCVRRGCGGVLTVHDDPCHCGPSPPPCGACTDRRAECTRCGEQYSLDDVHSGVFLPKEMDKLMRDLAPRVDVLTTLDPRLSGEDRAHWVTVSRRRMTQLARSCSADGKFICIPSFSSVFVLSAS